MATVINAIAAAMADGKPFSLTFRTYVPKDVVKRGEWFPPAVMSVK
jgi:hypothetical protein